MSLKRIVKKKSDNKPVEAPIAPMVTPNPGQMPPVGPENPNAVPPEGQPEEPEQQGIPVGEMGGYFEIMRQNYFEVKRCIWITGAIDWSIAIRTIQRLSFYDDDLKEPVTIYLSSPGGDCDAGFALIDVMDELKRKGIIINTIACGSCSSMASVILANGTPGHRYAFPSSRIMIHQAGIVADGFAGRLKDVSILQKELQNWTDSMNRVFKKQTGKTTEELRELTSFDNFMSANEAKKIGLIDKVKTKLV